MSESAIVVLVTAANEEQARSIAADLVAERLAACVNVIGPVRSVYRWEGEVRDEPEWQLVIKTRRELFAALANAVRTLHSYENPEILALPVAAAAEAYSAWIVRSTQP